MTRVFATCLAGAWLSPEAVLISFNMGTFAHNGDPCCDQSNWNVKAPYAAGKTRDPASWQDSVTRKRMCQRKLSEFCQNLFDQGQPEDLGSSV